MAALSARATTVDDPSAPLVGWGFDPIYFGERRCNRHDLDRVGSTQPNMSTPDSTAATSPTWPFAMW